MFHRLRQLPIRTRRLMLALCALMLALQPVGAAFAEGHELVHEPSGSHISLAVDAGSTDCDPDAGTTGNSLEAVLHVLLAGAHVCGPGAAMAPLAPGIMPVPQARLVAETWVPAVRSASLIAPFRPPIFA